MRRGSAVGNVPATATGVAATSVRIRGGVPGPVLLCAGRCCLTVSPPAGRGERAGHRTGDTAMSIGSSARRDVGDDGAAQNGSIPGPRTAADAYRVSDDQIHRARLVVARNCGDPDDLRQLLDMLGLISVHPDQPPPVGR